VAEVSVVIPTYSRFDLLVRCIKSLCAQDIDVEIIVVDNNSPSRIDKKLLTHVEKEISILRLDRNFFYCGAVNRGAAMSASPYLAVLNDDAYVEPTWAGKCIEQMRSAPQVGAIASRVMNSRSGLLDSAGDGLTISGLPFNRGWGEPFESKFQEPRFVFSAAGSCAFYERGAFDDAGGFDESFTAYLDDIDLGFRMQLRGRSCIYSPDCVAYHQGGATYKPRFRANFLMERNRIWNLAKNMPASVLRGNVPRIWYEAIAPAPLMGGRSVSAWAAGWSQAALGMPRVFGQRCTVQARRLVTDEYIGSILTDFSPEVCHL
jgi:GT2 family glycosyltransferase